MTGERSDREREEALRLLGNLCRHGVSGGCDRLDCVPCLEHGFTFMVELGVTSYCSVCVEARRLRISRQTQRAPKRGRRA